MPFVIDHLVMGGKTGRIENQLYFGPCRSVIEKPLILD
jgi:hypothetical protein